MTDRFVALLLYVILYFLASSWLLRLFFRDAEYKEHEERKQ